MADDRYGDLFDERFAVVSIVGGAAKVVSVVRDGERKISSGTITAAEKLLNDSKKEFPDLDFFICTVRYDILVRR